MYSHGGGWSSSSRHFFMERGENLFNFVVAGISVLVIAVVVISDSLKIYLQIKHDEEEHEKRMKEIKEKEQV